MTTTPEEKDILTKLKSSWEGTDKEHPNKLSKLQEKILTDLTTEFEASEGRTTSDKVKEIVQNDIDHPPKNKVSLGNIFGKAKEAGQKIIKKIGEPAAPGDHTDMGISLDIPVTAEAISQLTANTYTLADKPKTIQGLIKEATGPTNGVLTPKEIENLNMNPDFVKLLGGKPLKVINNAGHDKDEIQIGTGNSAQHLNLNTLGVTIADPDGTANTFAKPKGTAKGR